MFVWLTQTNWPRFRST